MQTHHIIDSHHLEDCLFKFCRAGSTGTVFITTENNQSCQIILEDGEVKALALGQKRGFEAILELNETRIKRYSFIKNMKFPLTIYANIICSDTVLNILGYFENDISNSQNYLAAQDTFHARQL